MYNLQDTPHEDRSVIYHLIKVSLEEQTKEISKDPKEERWDFIKLHHSTNYRS